MTVKLKLLAFGLVALLGAAALIPAAAWASEPEDPFWKVAGTRLEAGSSKKASIVNVNGVKTRLLTKLATAEISLHCEKGALAEGTLEGSQAKAPGKVSGVLEIKECKLFHKEGETFKEQSECKIGTIKSGKLEGALWLEGTKVEGGTSAVALLKPKELTEGNPVIAKIIIEGCTAFDGVRSLEGSFALKLLPQNEEFTFIQWTLPETAITSAWLPPSQQTKVGMTYAGNTATLQGEMKTELESKEKFGGGTEPTVAIEAPFWGVGGKRLELGEERELEDPPTAPVKLAWKLGKSELETRCNGAGFKEPRLKGSLNQHDGKFEATSLEFSECKLWAKEAGVYVEQPLCEAAPPNTGRLTGKLWLKGTAAGRSMIPVLVLEPESLTAGKPVLAKESVKGVSCLFTTAEYAIEGALPFRLQPESVEAQIVNLNIPESSTAVWQSAEQQAEGQVNLWHGTELLTIKIGNIPVKLKGGGPFGGGSAGVGEIGFETNTGKISGPIKSFPEVATFTPSPASSPITCKFMSGEPSGVWVIQTKTSSKEGRQAGETTGPHEWLQIKKWGNCTDTIGNSTKVTCNLIVERQGTGGIYPLGTTGTTGCEMIVGEPSHCILKLAVEGNKARTGVTLKNLGVNEVEIGGELAALTSTSEETEVGVCAKQSLKASTEGKLKFASPLKAEGEKLV